ncbi:hypothetical protein WJX72_008791 [[Myrmecia] bisecta]|uniref:Dihydroxyacetone kinase n=1 Tax=[Myrmecia] bisecta TaxID=41462 RepID=A0AAW1QRM0_9CHLO
MVKLINAPASVAEEAIEGLVATTPHLARLDGYPNVKVVLDKTADKSKVAVISGGGSGHEPAHAGYIGRGMLTAAVCGDVFASPSADAVLAAVRAVTGPAGCLLVVKNYTGDRLNFGLAAEIAKSEGFWVEMVVVGDDCALPKQGIAGRRGIAGTVFVHKVAGAASAAGASLEEVKAAAEGVAASLGSMGVATSTCTLPGEAQGDRIPAGHMELGMGIHGEPGASQAPIQPVDQIVAQVLDRIISKETNYLPLQAHDPVALLVNALGGTALESQIAAHAALDYAQGKLQLKVERVYVGSFMSALDMTGISLTLLRVDQQRLQYLDAPTQAPAWPHTSAVYSQESKLVPMPVAPQESAACQGSPASLSAVGAAAKAAIQAATQSIIAASAELDAMDRRVGDGDCGSTLRRGAQTLQADLDKLPLNDPVATVAAIARSVSTMGGSSGALYNIFFTAAAGALHSSSPGQEVPSVATCAAAFQTGVAAMQRYGGASAGDRTMLDALLPAARAFKDSAAGGFGGAIRAAASAAEQGAEATKSMAASAGRSSYVPMAALADTADPGAQAVACWLRAIATSLYK